MSLSRVLFILCAAGVVGGSMVCANYLLAGAQAALIGGMCGIHFLRRGWWMRYYDGFIMPIVEFTHSGLITNCNVAFQKLLREAGVRRGNLFAIMLPSQDDVNIANILQQQCDDPISLEVKIRGLPDYIAAMNVICNDEGRRIGFLTDITELKELETKFYHSQKMQAIGQLAGGIAHDFNNIMTTVLGICDLLLMRHAPSDQSFVGIKQIQQNATRAISLVKQLLAFSRKQIMTPSIVNVANVLDELSNNMIRRLIGESIALDLQFDRDHWCIRIDASQFEQVIINLAVNARDAMHVGGTLTIKTKNIEVVDNKFDDKLRREKLYSADSEAIKNGSYVLIEVSDTGSGIKSANMSKIFEPFFSTKPQHMGSGLGLSTVYGIVKQTGGYIYLSSEIGVGTTFYILFKSAGTAAEVEQIAKRPEDDAMTYDLAGTETLMVVEDECNVRRLCVDALRNKGYSMLEAASCEEAIPILEANKDKIELIITDVVMRGMSGFELAVIAGRIKPDIKVIMISGYTEETVPQLLTGACRMLPKPFTLKQLAATVRQALGNKDTVA